MELARRSSILALEEAMQGVDPGFQEGLRHHFGYMTYCREMSLKQDSLVVGKIHRFPCVNILSQGSVVVSGEFESDTYHAPFTWVSCAGTKRAIYAKTDCVWTTVHQNPTNTHDMDELEKYLIADDFTALEDGV